MYVESKPKSLGIVVRGSLAGGVDVKLAPHISVEWVKVGQYVTIEGQEHRFFGMVTDVRLEAIDSQLPLIPPDVSDPFIAEVIAGTATYGTIHVVPNLVMKHGDILGIDGPQTVKTVPPHFASVREASDEDVQTIFGKEDESRFAIGTPLDMETKVCLNIDDLFMRSNGIFGKSGTGKTFLTRLLLAWTIYKNQERERKGMRPVAVHLVLDMHNEYGWEGQSEDPRYPSVKGLKQIFPSRVAVFTLDEESARRRGLSPDYVVEIGYDEIEPEDMATLKEHLGLTDLMQDAVYEMAERYGDRKWLKTFLDTEIREVQAQLPNISSGTLRGLKNRLNPFKRFSFLSDVAKEGVVDRILEYLERGINVVLEFGKYDNNLDAYLLVSNLLTRRIHDRYVRRTDEAGGDLSKKPVPLVITLEEAHKFLNPQVAPQTSFALIAREMRKYNVTLLVIDQRPSGIDPEIMSQIGTKITCLLDDERDVESVLAGVSGRNEFRGVLSRLEPKQQALIFGHAVPMPVVVRIRPYGTPESYAEFAAIYRDTERGTPPGQRAIKDLYGEGQR